MMKSMATDCKAIRQALKVVGDKDGLDPGQVSSPELASE